MDHLNLGEVLLDLLLEPVDVQLNGRLLLLVLGRVQEGILLVISLQLNLHKLTLSFLSQRFHTAKTKYRKIWKQIFPEKEYRGLSPNFLIHASVSELYIPTIGMPIVLEELCRQILGLYKSLTDT
jgi:hypothetical protein